jgi:nucleoside-diphosphate-sugar epimerase
LIRVEAILGAPTQEIIMTIHPPRTALIVGGAGGFGRAAAKALLAHGWRVRALTRNVTKSVRGAAHMDGLQWVAGDAMKPQDVLLAADGVDVIVHAAHPPAYRGWSRLALPMLESSIAAALAVGARVVLPGTVYNFDPDAAPVVAEDTPQTGATSKGRIRIAMEARLEQASAQGLKVLILRCGDFFGPPPANSWLTSGMVQAGKPLRQVVYPGDRDVGHAWAYLPDVGETLARLLDQEERLGRFERFHFAGHWLERGVEMAEAARRAAGRPNLPIRAFPWFVVHALAPINETFTGVVEMRHLWRKPLRLDNSRLVAFLGAEPHTPLDQALFETLDALDCLPSASAARPKMTAAGAL